MIIEINWKHTVGIIAISPIPKSEFLKSFIYKRKYSATPNNWIKVRTWAASWAYEKNDDNMKQKLNIAIISSKYAPRS